jgi:hypothetical protein
MLRLQTMAAGAEDAIGDFWYRCPEPVNGEPTGIGAAGMTGV